MTISRDTTFVTGPLRADGSIDFAAAINTRLAEGITPEENACVLLYRAMGPAPERTAMPHAFFQLIGMQQPPPDGKYLQPLDEVIRAGNMNEAQQDRLFRQLDAAMSRPWKRAEFPQIATWLDQNEEALRVVHTAVERNKYYSPLVLDDEEIEGPVPLMAALLPGVQTSRSIARMLSVRAMLHLGEGNHDAAWSDLHASHRLGRLVGMGPTLIEALVGYAIEEMTVEAKLTFMDSTHPTSAQTKRYFESLEAMPPISRMSEKVNWTERCTYLDALLVMARNRQEAVELLGVEQGLVEVSRIANRVGFQPSDWDVALRTGNGWYDRVVAAFELPSHAQRRAAMDMLLGELRAAGARIQNVDALLRAENSATARNQQVARLVGDVVASLLIPGVSRSRVAEDRARQRAENLRLALALAAYHADRSQYPGRVDELAPQYIAQVPADVFTDRPLIYHRQAAGYLLYSVGENARDDNGRSYSDDPAGDDLLVRMPRPAANAQ